MCDFLPKRPGGEEESYHQGTASMSTAAALEHDDAFTPAPPARRLTVTERARETPVHAETEVLVVGGGPAGCAAALAARRAGGRCCCSSARTTSAACPPATS